MGALAWALGKVATYWGMALGWLPSAASAIQLSQSGAASAGEVEALLGAAGLVHLLISPAVGAALAGLTLGLAARINKPALALGAAAQSGAGLLVRGGATHLLGLECLALGLSFICLVGGFECAKGLRAQLSHWRRHEPET